MIITFCISNFLSFNDTVEFSMRSGKVESLPEHTIKGEKRSDISLLKAGVIYGANASGKSNFIKAVSFCKDLIVDGFGEVATENRFFRLDSTNKHKPTYFEFEFKHKEKIYAYGVVMSLQERKIKEEWLFELTAHSNKPIFERTVKENGSSDIDFSVRLDAHGKKRFDVYKEDIRADQLFLTELNRKNIDSIQNITAFKNAFEWFEHHLTIIYPHSKPQGLDFMGNDQVLKESFSNFLKMFRTGIELVETTEEDIDSILPTELKDEIEKDLIDSYGIVINYGGAQFSISKNNYGEIKIFSLSTKHKLKDSEELIIFDLEDESDGTRRLIELIPVLLGLSNQAGIYFIDEIDRSLHPELTHKILELFFENSENIESQLIITTHESSLLDLSLLRRDEIWFTEKDQHGATKMYSLEEFKPRLDKEVRRAYLQGRFGAIPFISSVANLGWLKQSKNS